MRQMMLIGVDSLWLTLIISGFMGAVFTVQVAYQLVSDFIPAYVIGSVVSDSTILELAPSITALVLAGKIGSSIASEIGTMKVTEQIDAMEVMGINSAGFLILPKILATIISLPMLNVFAIGASIMMGAFVGEFSDILGAEEFFQGAVESFVPYNILISMTKAFTFAFMISTVSSYQGFYISGGALEVGQSSTRAVVFSCVSILFFDYLITELMLGN